MDKEKPVRLNKYLSDAGFCSRREADRLIEAGRVLIDGVVAQTGQKVYAGQYVSCDGKELRRSSKMVLIAFNKPAGVECTAAPDNPDNIVDFIGYPERIYPIGRLDKPSRGLILLTNTGELVNGILKASNYHEKEYVVRTDRPVTSEFIKKMGAGVTLDDGTTTRQCRVWKINRNTFGIILTQGLNRQIRRMSEACGCTVTDLKRIRIMNITLNDLPEGKWRALKQEEIKELVRQIDAGRSNE